MHAQTPEVSHYCYYDHSRMGLQIAEEGEKGKPFNIY